MPTLEDEIMTFKFRGLKIGQCKRSNYNIVGALLPDLTTVVDDAMPIFTDGDTPESVEYKVKTIRMAYEYARCQIANKMADGTSLYDIIADFPDMEEFEAQGFTAEMLIPFRMFLWHIKASLAQNTFALLVSQKKIDKAKEIRQIIVKEFITNIETLPDEIRNHIAERLVDVDDEGNKELRAVLDQAKKALTKKKRKTDKNISKENTTEDDQE